MKPIEFLNYKTKQIALVDLSNAQPADAVRNLLHSHQEIAKKPAKSVLILTDVTAAVYNSESAAAIKDFSKKNTPYIKASAVVGVEGLRMVLLKSIIALTGRKIQLCKNRDEALEWLVNQ